MSMTHTSRRDVTFTAGIVAAAAAALLAGCGSSSQESPSTSTTPTTSATTSAPETTPSGAVTPEPTEKGVEPTGGNLFTPDVKAPNPQTIAPGQHPGINGIP